MERTYPDKIITEKRTKDGFLSPNKNRQEQRRGMMRFRAGSLEIMKIPIEIFKTIGITQQSTTDTPSLDAGTVHQDYVEVEGYSFAWGNIMERRSKQYVIWDYYLAALLTECRDTGKSIGDIQQLVFASIEKEIDCTSRDIAMSTEITAAWRVYPGVNSAMLTQITHHTAEKEARVWAEKELIPVFLKTSGSGKPITH